MFVLVNLGNRTLFLDDFYQLSNMKKQVYVAVTVHYSPWLDSYDGMLPINSQTTHEFIMSNDGQPKS